MKPEGSLPHSQVPATCPQPEPPEDTSYYYLPIYAWFFQVVSFPQVSPPNPCIPIRATCPANLIFLDLITRNVLGDQ